ncbi:hypothetical protein THAOC_25383, partial [Thalassiosira oceanica]
PARGFREETRRVASGAGCGSAADRSTLDLRADERRRRPATRPVGLRDRLVPAAEARGGTAGATARASDGECPSRSRSWPRPARRRDPLATIELANKAERKERREAGDGSARGHVGAAIRKLTPDGSSDPPSTPGTPARRGSHAEAGRRTPFRRPTARSGSATRRAPVSSAGAPSVREGEAPTCESPPRASPGRTGTAAIQRRRRRPTTPIDARGGRAEPRRRRGERRGERVKCNALAYEGSGGHRERRQGVRLGGWVRRERFWCRADSMHLSKDIMARVAVLMGNLDHSVEAIESLYERRTARSAHNSSTTVTMSRRQSLRCALRRSVVDNHGTQTNEYAPSASVRRESNLGDQSRKRPKTSSGDRGADARNDDLEYEIRALKSENARLRKQLQLFEGRQDVLVPKSSSRYTLRSSANLSRVDASVIALVASFLGTSLELLNLALTCKSFGWQQLASGLDLSLAEEAARQAVCSKQNAIEGARTTLSKYVRGGTTWLSILHESEHPLKFCALLGGGIDHKNGRRTSVARSTNNGFGTAIAREFVMESGSHYAEFHVITGQPWLGIVRPLPNLVSDRYATSFNFFCSKMYEDFSATNSSEWGEGDVIVCHFNLHTGTTSWTDWDEEFESRVDWEGMEKCRAGDRIGTLLDLEEGTLAVYRNNRRLGVMKDGLSGAYCWFARIWEGDAVEIKRGQPPRT